MTNGSDKYKHCNHHHELTEDHEVVNIGDCEFVANKAAIPLLQALNDVGLKTRSHHYTGPNAPGFVCLMMDNIQISIENVKEKHSDRSDHDGPHLVISWGPEPSEKGDTDNG